MLPVLRTLRVLHIWACFGFQTGALSGLVIANRIINLLPWTCPSDFVFMSNPCGNFMLSLILKDNSCCQLSASITRFLRTDLADFVLMSLPLREFHVDSGFDWKLLLPTFAFHYPIPKNRSADFISCWETLTDLTTFDADVLKTCFCKPDFHYTWSGVFIRLPLIPPILTNGVPLILTPGKLLLPTFISSPGSFEPV